MLSNPQSIILLRGCQYFQTSERPVFEYRCWALTWQSFLLWLWGRRISGCIALTNQTRGALFYYHIPVKPDSSSTAETQSTPHGEQFGQCLTASSSAPSWAIYFTANTLSDYWCVAPCHAAAVSLQDQKDSQRLNSFCLDRKGTDFWFWTCNLCSLDICGIVLTQTDGVCATASVCPLTFCRPIRAKHSSPGLLLQVLLS